MPHVTSTAKIFGFVAVLFIPISSNKISTCPISSKFAWQEKVDRWELLPMLECMYCEHLVEQVRTDLKSSIHVEGGGFCNECEVGVGGKHVDTLSGG